MSITAARMAAAKAAVTVNNEPHERVVGQQQQQQRNVLAAKDEMINNRTERLVNDVLGFLEYSSEEDNQTIIEKATAEFESELQQELRFKEKVAQKQAFAESSESTTTATSSSIESEEDDDDDDEDDDDDADNDADDDADDDDDEDDDMDLNEALANATVANAAVAANAADKSKKPTAALDSYVMEALKKIIESYPSWNYNMPDRDVADSVTVNAENSDTGSSAHTTRSTPSRSNASKCSAGHAIEKNSLYINEIKRVLSTEATGHPPKDSPEYYKAAERYALYGNDFDEFPQDLTTLYETKSFQPPVPDTSAQSILGDGLYPTPTPAELASSLAASNYAKPYGVSTIAGTTYYHHHLGLQQNWRQNLAAANNSSAIGMYLNANKLSYVPTQAAAAPTHLLYNQQTVNAANFISSSLANAALASSPLIYTNPLLAGNAQNYLQNWYQKQHSYVNNPLVPNAAAVGFYERLLYAQVLQKQIYNYQTRAVAMAALYQQQQHQQQQQQLQHQQQQQQHAQLHNFQYRPRLSRSTVGGFSGTAPTFYNPNANDATAGPALVINEVLSTSALPPPTISLLSGDSDTSGPEADGKSIYAGPAKKSSSC